MKHLYLELLQIESLQKHLVGTSLNEWARGELLESLLPIIEKGHGDQKRWLAALQSLPEIHSLEIDLKTGCYLSGITHNELLEEGLRQLMPWRKGPFKLADINIDTEWHSDFKWDRIIPHLDLKNKNILDVGSGNGYYGYRMIGEGAKTVIGIDPNWLFLHQFFAIKHYLKDLPIWQLPLTLESLTKELEWFDITFSMGVFYHRRSPIDHLYELKDTLKNNGQLVLETLVLEKGDENEVFIPKDRYAMMRNVWFIPSVKALIHWLERVGFREIEVADLTKTEITEQRTTDWMTYQSLVNFLDPNDPTKTVEGYPAPLRAIIIANK